MRRLARLLALAALLGSSAALAQSYSQVKGMEERFRIDLGGFLQDFDTTVRYDPAGGGSGTEISLEDDLGYSTSKTSFKLDGYWRFGPRGRLDFAYQTFRRGSSHTLEKEIVFGDEVYAVGATVSSDSSVDVGELYYSYSMLNTGEAEVGLMLGVSTFFNKWEFEAAGAVSGGGGSQAGSMQREATELIAPIPAIGAFARYTLLPGFFAHGRVKWMKATISDYTGSMLHWRAGLDYYFSPNVGIGAAWDSTELDIEKQQDATVALDYSYSGPVGYLSITF